MENSKIATRDRTGPNNPNWKGGRLLATNGYVLIRVGVDHHLADVRGYAYEHRINAEIKLGRRLLPGEEVHHDDENKLNNQPYNLIVKKDKHDHLSEHRKSDKGLRMSGEKNHVINCACGCGSVFNKYDSTNRPRKYISGHNPGDTPLQDNIYNALLQNGDLSIDAIKSSVNKESVKTTLGIMIKKGLLFRKERGIYSIKHS